MAKQWNTSSKRKREPCKLPRNAKILKQSTTLKRKRQVTDVGGTPKSQRVSQAPQSNKATLVTKRGQKNRPSRGPKPPNGPNGRDTWPNPQYIGPYLVTNSPKKSPEPRSPNITNNPNGRNASKSPQYLGPYPVTNAPERNHEPECANIPNNPKGPDTSTKPQYLGPYPVTYPKVNTKSESLRIPNSAKGEDAPENAQHIAAHPVTNIQKGNLGKGRPSTKFPYSENYPEANGPKKNHRHRKPKSSKSPKQRASASYQHGGTSQVAHRRKKNRGKRGGRFTNRQKNPEGVGAPMDSQNDCTHQVANHLKETSPEPQPKSPKGLDLKGLQPSARPQTFYPPTTSTISPQLATSLRKQIDQYRPISRRNSTGKLPTRDKLTNKFVMGIPKQRFGISRRRDSTASATPVMTAEYCGDPFRTAIKERLAAGEPRAPPRSEFAINSRIYHAAGEYAKRISELQKGEESGMMKQVMSNIAGMAYARVAKLRIMMRDDWIGYDEFATYHGHCGAIEYNIRTMGGFFREAMPAMLTIGKQLKAPLARPRVNPQKGRERGRPFGRCLNGRVEKRYRKSKKNRLCENIRELKQG